MEIFSAWIKNIVFLTVFIALVDMIVPDKMGKYVKVISGFLMMLVIINPLVNILNGDIYFDNYYLKQTSIIEENRTTQDVNNMDDFQQKMTISTYQEKLIENIDIELEEKLQNEVNVSIDINENLSNDNFGTLKSVWVEIVEESDGMQIDKIVIGKNEDNEYNNIDKKTSSIINKFFLDFYNLNKENITISKKVIKTQ